MGMKSLLRVMEHEVHRDEMERNNNNEWIGQESSLVSALLKHDGKSVKDDRIRDPLVCCHMHLLSLKSLSRQCKKVFPYFFFFFGGLFRWMVDKVHMKLHCLVEK